jgi:hypothetical protein
MALVGFSARARAAGGPGAGPGAAAEAGPPDDAALIGGTSSCPQPADVWAELGTLVPRDRVAARLRALGHGASAVEIVDLGVPYRVIAAGRAREYRDDARDCAHRARIAALFVALVVDPADILEPGAAAAPAPKPAAPPAVIAPAPPAREPAPPPLARLGLAAAVDAGVGSADTVAQAGLELRLAAGRGRLSFVSGVVGLAPVDTSVGGVTFHQWRVPADTGVRVALGGRTLERYAEVGLAAAWLREEGRDLATARAQTTVELGARAALGLALATDGRAAPFAALHAEVVPSPPSIFALPRGDVGSTPFFWVGLSAGVAVGF